MKRRVVSSILTVLVAAVTCLGSSAVTAKAASVPSNANLLNTYGSAFTKSGVAIPAFKMSDKNVINFTKGEYNSVTAENEMKPDAILGGSANKISVAQAKQLGYYIPAGYSESTVPKLNFSSADNMLKICAENGLTMRGHTLVWHSQTPEWFFKEGYNGNGAYVSKDTMNKRMEFYVKSVINHVHSGQYKNVIYAWDVVNEFLHADRSGWLAIYGKPSTNAQFVKDAFKYAYEALTTCGMQDKVKLFYNDYNTYMEVNDVIKLINFINSDKKVCAGIGMQSHLGTNFPSVAYYKAAVEAFRKAGFEIQITELDVGGANQDKYCYDLFKAIIDEKKAGANITAIVWWGLSDDVSWRNGDNPLLFSRLGVKKSAYNNVLKAYFDSGLTIDEKPVPDVPVPDVPVPDVPVPDVPVPDVPVEKGLALDYSVNKWDGAYQIQFKITNKSAAPVSTWTLKIKKSDINIDSKWNFNVKEVGDYYVITPMEWNSNIAPGQTVDFGLQGKGSFNGTLNYTLS